MMADNLKTTLAAQLEMERKQLAYELWLAQLHIRRLQVELAE